MFFLGEERDIEVTTAAISVLVKSMLAEAADGWEPGSRRGKPNARYGSGALKEPVVTLVLGDGSHGDPADVCLALACLNLVDSVAEIDEDRARRRGRQSVRPAGRHRWRADNARAFELARVELAENLARILIHGQPPALEPAVFALFALDDDDVCEELDECRLVDRVGVRGRKREMEREWGRRWVKRWKEERVERERVEERRARQESVALAGRGKRKRGWGQPSRPISGAEIADTDGCRRPVHAARLTPTRAAEKDAQSSRRPTGRAEVRSLPRRGRSACAR
jgi:hypothetical protein